MNLPQYTAGLALYRTMNVYREYGALSEMEPGGMGDGGSKVLPAGVSSGGPGGGLGGPHPVYCFSPNSPCGNICTNLSTDSANCGECNTECGDGMCCIAGKCAAVDTDYDSNNCGDCNSKCPSHAPACCSGECLSIEDYNRCENCGLICPTGYYCGDDNYTCVGCPVENGSLTSPGSNANYIIYNQCSAIDELVYSFYVNKALSAGTGGFSLQFNSYSNSDNYQDKIIQFVFHIQNNQILAHIQYPKGTSDPSKTDYDWHEYFPGISLQNDTLTENYTLEVDLSNDMSGNITGATFKVQDDKGKQYVIPASASAFPTGEYAYAISEFQANLVGRAVGETADFTAGGAATLTYSSNGQLCVEGAHPKCSPGSYQHTLEKSNAEYGALSSCCGASLIQSVSINA